MSTRPRQDASASTAYVVLDANDRVIQVGEDLRDQLAPFLGHVLWEHMPGAEPLCGPGFDEARRIGSEVEFPVFYRGRAKRLRAVPAGETLAVHVERLAELEVTTLGTLRESLLRIEAELPARGSGQLDRPAPSSLRALP
ncbi:MAG TPA: hypothetical protein VFR38_13815 [Gaiellaceae bacterium]|nr:hypothetical protein [Gaiellaceae bacterium]